MINLFTAIRRFRKPALPAKPVFKPVLDGKFVILSETPVRYKRGSARLTTGFRERFPLEEEDTSYVLRTQVYSSNGHKMGTYSYAVDAVGKRIVHGLIATERDYRRKGVGEIMRLASIMELKENHLSSILIEAVSCAIPFHLFFKFKPCLKQKNKAFNILSNIAHKSKIDKESRKDANMLVSEISTSEGDELNTALFKRVNHFILKYIKRYKNDWFDAMFPQSLPMELTKSEIKKSGDFFNNLFKKHGIDYTV